MALAIAILFILPFIDKPKHVVVRFRYIWTFIFWFFVSDVLLLGWIGSQPVVEPLVTMGQMATAFYFSFLLFFLPISSRVDDCLYTDFLKKKKTS
jgi:quinol-cytochrome oxidoreductase complex cytochrome b subunit